MCSGSKISPSSATAVVLPRFCKTMQGIIKDPDVGAHFVVLLVIKLIDESQLEGSVTVYQADGRRFREQLVQEEEEF